MLWQQNSLRTGVACIAAPLFIAYPLQRPQPRVNGHTAFEDTLTRFLPPPQYFAAIVPARLYPETALALVVYELLATILAVSVNGVLFRGGARIIVFFLCMGCTAIAMSRTRKLNAYAKWREARHLSRILDKHRSFLYTLVPRRVYDEQSLLQSMADLTPHTGSLNGHNSSIRSFSSLSSSIPDPAGHPLLHLPPHRPPPNPPWTPLLPIHPEPLFQFELRVDGPTGLV